MTKEKLSVKRIYKDSVFRMLFREKRELLPLYNAIYGTDYEDPEQMEVTTLENAIYMGFKNDISCIVDFHLALLEHQSTVNPNMPLRYLMYVSDLYEKLTAELDIYSSRQIRLPNPGFVVLYNGQEEQPEQRILLLSDAYHWKGEETALELKVLQLNINPGYNEDIVSKCSTLLEYIQFVSRTRIYQKQMPLSEAVNRAVEECIREGILEDFLRKNRAEVVKMSIYEYDEEKHLKTLQEESREDGIKLGISQGIEQGMEQGRDEILFSMFRKNKTPQDISEFTGQPLEYLYQVQEKYLTMVKEKGSYEAYTKFPPDICPEGISEPK